MKFIKLFALVISFWIPRLIQAEVRVIFDAESPTKGIQEALDQCASQGGGAVFIPGGRYVISRTIRVPTEGNMLIYGEGSATLIEAEPEYTGHAAANPEAGQKEFRVIEPSLFRLNDQVVVLDDSLSGEEETSVGVIIGISGDRVVLDTPLKHSYKKAYNARIIHTHHLMSGTVGQDITVRDIQFAGSLRKNHQGLALWEVNGGLILRGDRIRIENVTVRDVPADALFVGGANRRMGPISVSGCFVENAGRRGLHIGGSPRNVTVIGNHFKRIGGIGIYFCHGGQRTVISGNTVSDIGTYHTDRGKVDYIQKHGFSDDEYLIKTQVAGIGGLGGGGVEIWEHDKNDVISNNVIFNSRGSGISFLKWFQEKGGRPGENILITGNNIYKMEKCGMFIFAAKNILASANLIRDTPSGIECCESVYCLFTGNSLRNCETAFRFYSMADEFPTEENVATGNILINCGIPTESGHGSKNIVFENNYMTRAAR